MLFARTGIGSAEKWSFFFGSGGIFSLPLAFADRGDVFAIADCGAFILPFPFAIVDAQHSWRRELTETKPHHRQVSHWNRNTPPSLLVYSHLLAYSPNLAETTRPTDSGLVY